MLSATFCRHTCATPLLLCPWRSHCGSLRPLCIRDCGDFFTRDCGCRPVCRPKLAWSVLVCVLLQKVPASRQTKSLPFHVNQLIVQPFRPIPTPWAFPPTRPELSSCKSMNAHVLYYAILSMRKSLPTSAYDCHSANIQFCNRDCGGHDSTCFRKAWCHARDNCPSVQLLL